MPSDYTQPDEQIEETELTDDPTSGGHLNDAGIAAVQGPPETPGDLPINQKFHNDVYSFKDKRPELHEKYPEGVKFDADGYPDFSPYAKEAVEIDMEGNYTTDYDKAEEAAGLDRTTKGYTWHHHQDGKTMLLVPTDLHRNVGHTGGVSVIKNQRELRNGA